MLVNFLIEIIIILVLYMCMKFLKGYLSPIKVFEYYWGIQIVCCLLIFGNSVLWKYSGLLWMIFLFLLIIFFSLIFNKNIHKRVQEKYEINMQINKIFLLILTVLGIIYALLLIRKYGFSFNNLFNLNTLLEMNNSIAVQRYSGGSSNGLLSKILLIFVYSAPLCGGYSFVFARNIKDKFFSVITLFPELVILLTENAKAAMIGCVVFFVTGWLVGNLTRYQQIKPFKFKTIIIFCVLFILLLSLLAVTMVLRLGEWNIEAFEIVRNKLGNYIFGHIPAFDNWFSNNIGNFNISLGKQTFVGIASLFGISEREQGIYRDNYDGGALATNVYSYFRGIVEDFGMIGAILVIIVFLLIATHAYIKIVNGKRKVIYQIFLTISYSFILFFPVSLFSYNSFVMSFFVFAFYLYIIKQKLRFKIKI